ncbi:hypothetical protein [Exiguobacterium mexicanum]|uniref:hypothetical protein n=1 Tax=Exiguobacterium mexicanum TaxID=340146 RepID=UPI00110EC36A|nr:hypothetical protein [Exiguobacterium mexicanum]
MKMKKNYVNGYLVGQLFTFWGMKTRLVRWTFTPLRQKVKWSSFKLFRDVGQLDVFFESF